MHGICTFSDFHKRFFDFGYVHYNIQNQIFGNTKAVLTTRIHKIMYAGGVFFGDYFTAQVY
jgi:hypothetical protein